MRLMLPNRSMLAAAVMAIGLAIGVPAHAQTYDFSYSDGANSASGTLTIGSANTGYGGFSGNEITGITGTYDVSGITGLLGFAVCCSSPADDQILSLTPLYLDLAGLGFAVGPSLDVNLYYDAAATVPGYYDLWSTDGNETYTGSGPGTFTLTATPLPAALPLLSTGLGFLGLLGWRRKRKASASQRS